MTSRDTRAAPSAVPADASVIGLRLSDRYRILSEIGHGVHGGVYVALDERANQRVAVRWLPVGARGEVVHRSGVIGGSKSHPALIGVLDTGVSDDGRFFIVLNLAEGAPLSDAFSRSLPMPVSSAIHFALKLGTAVEALHNAGLVHGALRPRNVRVLADGGVRLLDVEVAALRRTAASEAAPAEYLAPEQLRGELLTEKTDVYAFGVMLYEMLSGVPPFQGTTREAVAAAQQAGPARLRRAGHPIPKPIKQMLAKALDPNPGRRLVMPQVLNHLADALIAPQTSSRKQLAAVSAIAVTATIALVVAWTALNSYMRPRAASPPPPIAVTPEARPMEPATLAIPAPAAQKKAPPPAVQTPSPSAAQRRAPPAPQTATVPAAVTPAPTLSPRAVTPSAGSSSPTPTRRESARPAVDRAAAPASPSTEKDEFDQGAVIDWLLQRSRGD